MKYKLPASISSPLDLRSAESEIMEYARWHSHNAIKLRSGKKPTTPAPELSPATADIVRQLSPSHSLESANYDELLTTLRGIEKQARVVSITLAAPAPLSLKQTLTQWCRDNIADDVLVNFSFNSRLCGGMVIRFGSHIYDWSFRRQLLKERAKFPEILRNV